MAINIKHAFEGKVYRIQIFISLTHFPALKKNYDNINLRTQIVPLVITKQTNPYLNFIYCNSAIVFEGFIKYFSPVT